MNNKPKGPMGWKNKLRLNLLNKYMELYFYGFKHLLI
jgi:hypothetical protein